MLSSMATESPRRVMGSPQMTNEAAIAATTLPTLKPRAYQQEMLAESLRQNTIIAMDTGSGKTQIAVLRIEEELMRCAKDKLVWFLTPTVALAQQQHSVISKQLPMYQNRLLLGSDNVDHWSSQIIWDRILMNIRIVVSTPQVLLDAMSHAFVKLERLSLLVFDEAHRCVKESPLNGIMRLYHHARLSGEVPEMPAILGLTATPATKATAEAVKILEENLHAICRTPVIQREELLKFTHRPELSINTYVCNDLEEATELLQCLDHLIGLTLVNIENDPYLKSLRARDDDKSRENLAKIRDSGKTFTRKELISLSQRGKVIQRELGSWAADVFVSTCAERFIEEAVRRSDNNVFGQWEDTEKIYMMQHLAMLPNIATEKKWGSQPDNISPKAQLLIKRISETYNSGFRVIVFAEQRATVIMLAHLLSVHPLMKGIVTKYFLGSSNFATRKSNITELSTISDQKDVLDELRAGKTNILVATSVLEEGIDVPACNLVVCYDHPKDLRSFIQRRGRARDRQSRLLLFIDSNDDDGIAKWASMEAQLKDIYADNMRKLEEIKTIENLEEESAEFFQIPATKAVLDHRNARQYLAYFCSTVSSSFTNNLPEYVIDRREYAPGSPEITAKVILPGSLDPSLRIAHSRREWKTEKAAKRDASFQAYLALYKAGLVDDNLMPIHRKKYADPETTPQEKQDKLIQVSGCWKPWRDIAQQRKCDVSLIPTRVCFESNALNVPNMILLLPRRIPCDWTFELFWNQDITLQARICNDYSTMPDIKVDHAARFTRELLFSAYQGRMTSEEMDYLTLFWPAETVQLTTEEWLVSIKGQIDPSTSIVDQSTIRGLHEIGIGRTSDTYARPFFIERIIEPATVDVVMQDVGTGDAITPVILEPHFQGTTFPKRADFLHPIIQADNLPITHTARQLVPVSACYIDRLPAKFAKFALFVPSITHKIEVLFVAERLATKKLSRVRFKDLTYVLTAISASAAQEASDYQRYEFLGDSLLKLITSINLVANNPLWHEGLLSAAKDIIVSNDRLARSALRLDLDEFILTKPFTGRKWRPDYISQFTINENSQQPLEEKRKLSTKTLADVVEALMGAAFLDGGYEKLRECAKTFLPETNWSSIDKDVRTMYMRAADSEQVAAHPKLTQMEEMVGYKFNKPNILLEALTHPCSNDGAPTYQRLEFLGDSLLDHLVVQEIFYHSHQFSHQDMHLMRTAVVNAHFLGVLCLGLYSTEGRGEVPTPGQSAHSMLTKHETYLWQMMRHGASWEIVNAQQEAKTRYEMWGEELRDAFNSSPNYPWSQLLRINPSKFFSDIIESLLGAIFVDSQGSLEACHEFLAKIGLLKYLHRIIDERVEILHPRNQLYEAAKSAKVEIRPGTQKRVVSSPESDKSATEDSTLVYTCGIFVNDEEIIYVDDGVNKLEVEARAAASAAEILRTRMKSPKIGVQADMKQDREKSGLGVVVTEYPIVVPLE